jgi:hypothetical protein
MSDLEISGCRLVGGGECPEQYDVFLGKERIGYLRLRFGSFTAKYPDSGGDFVYQASPAGSGVFCDDERERYLTRAVNACLFRHRGLAPHN